MLMQLHESHQSSVRTKMRARLLAYWPGMENDIDNIILSCKMCQEQLPSNPWEPIISKPRPTRPFQEIAMDFCSYAAREFLVIIDCFTDWPDIVFMGASKHNYTTSHQCPEASILSIWCTRCCVVRSRATVYFEIIQ